MRLKRLDLTAFGQFADASYELGDGEADFHLFYGPNEAGKSTALRAISGFLFGIAEQTPDAYLVKPSQLRVGAVVQSHSGEREWVRRKGRTKTLLDADGAPADESALSALLGGVSREQFARMFGLDHETLRSGGQELLRGSGSVGESLFSAGAGGALVHAVLRRLEQDAAEIYTPRGRKKALNLAIGSVNEAMKSVELSTTPQAWEQQRRALADAEAEQRKLEDEARQLKARSLQLARTRRVRTLIAKRRDLKQQLAELGSSPALPVDAAGRREAAQEQATEATHELRALDRRVAQLDAELAVLPEDDLALRLDADAVADLEEALGRHRAAASDLPKVRAKADKAQAEVAQVLARLDWPETPDQVASLRLGTAVMAAVRPLALEHAGLEQRRQQAGARTAEARENLETEQRRLGDIDTPARFDELSEALRRAQSAGQLGNQEQVLRAELVEVERARTALTRLLFGRPDANPEVDAVPTAAQIARFSKRLDKLDTRARELDRDAELSETAKRGAVAQIRELQAAGDVPTPDELNRLREARDELWNATRVALADDPHAPAADRFLLAIQHADDCADRLLRDSDRVAALERARTQQRNAEADASQIAKSRERLQTDQIEFDNAWRELWAAAGVRPQAPAQMLEWRQRYDELCELEVARATLQAKVERAADAARALSQALVVALGDVGVGASTTDDLTSLMHRASSLVRVFEDGLRQRAELQGRVVAAERELAARRRDAEQIAEALTEWNRRWAEAVAPLRLQPDASPAAAVAVLDQLQELFKRHEDYAGYARRAEGMLRDSAEFESQVRDLSTRIGLSFEGPAGEVARKLIDRSRAARQSARRREAVTEQLEALRAERAVADERHAAASGRLADMMRAADVETLDELIVAEQRAAQLRQLQAALAQNEEHLEPVGEGVPLAQLEREVDSTDPASLDVALAELDASLHEVDEQIASGRDRIASIRGGLAMFEESRAADQAIALQERIAKIPDLVHRYMRLRLAHIVLRREMEAYRQRNQGPILERASSVFRRLTLERYAGLEVDFDASDQAILKAVSAEASVGVEQLSDGARDQLYLALRVASLERYFVHGAPIPLVFDDILVHFDDERAAAALGVLAELSRSAQVLFFTHHARVAELARTALDGQLTEHRLASSASRSAVVQARV